MESLFRIFDNTADGVFIIDEEQCIVYWNEAAQHILGYSAEEVLGRLCYDILQGCDEESLAICHHHCRVTVAAWSGEPVTNYDVVAATAEGKMRWINVSIVNLAGPDDSAPLIVHIFRDATPQKRNEQVIRQVLDAMDLLQAKAHPVAPIPPLPSSRAEELTRREREVLTLLSQGLSTKGIAETLSISSSTVRNHIQNIFNKLQVHSRLEAVAYAFEHRLVNNK